MSETGDTTEITEAPAADRAPGGELIFVTGQDLSSWIEIVDRLQGAGRHRIGAQLLDAAASDISAALSSKYPGSLKILESAGDAAIDAVLLIGGDADQVSTALLDYVDDVDQTIVAPVTDRFWNKLPLYLISIPKAGTHLLFRLAEALGYKAGGLREQQPVGGNWYYLLNSNAHTSAIEFFCDELQKAPFGNRAHPFMRSPALFNYRNPLDILVSEANYWHIDGNSPLSVLLSPLGFEERLDRLIDNRWLLGTIRDRVGGFAAWLDCANVVPLSFEEMVGESGGGSDDVLEALIWSLQLKLHVPGRPAAIRRATSDRSSATFREGKINGWRSQIPASSLDQFNALPQDFMEAYGYGVKAPSDEFKPPAHAMKFRHRPLRVMTSSHFKVPFLIETDYLGYNIVSYMKRYYAVEITAGDFDLVQLSRDELAKLINAHNLPSLRGLIGIKHVDKEMKASIEGYIQDAVASQIEKYKREQIKRAEADKLAEVKRIAMAERAAEAERLAEIEIALAAAGDERVGQIGPPTYFLGYNLFRRRDGIIAIPVSLGAVDPRDYDLRLRPGVIAACSGLGARLSVFGMWLRWAYWDGAKI